MRERELESVLTWADSGPSGFRHRAGETAFPLTPPIQTSRHGCEGKTSTWSASR